MSSSDLPDPETGAPAGVERNGAPRVAAWPEPVGQLGAAVPSDVRCGDGVAPDTDDDAARLWQHIWRDALDAGFSVGRSRRPDVR